MILSDILGIVNTLMLASLVYHAYIHSKKGEK